MKMKIKKTDHYIQINGRDNQGEFKLEIQKDCSQMRIESEDYSNFIDLNYRELKVIRDCITEVLDSAFHD